MKMKINFLLYFFLLSIFTALGQSEVDSLLKQVQNAYHDTSKCQYLLEIGDYYENRIPDSAIYFYQKAEVVSWNNLLKVKQLNASEAKNFADLYSKALRYRAIVLINQKRNGPILQLLNTSLRMAEIILNKKAISACYTNIGVYYLDQAYYEKALEYYYKALHISEQIQDKKGCANLYNNIANIHNLQFEYKKAANYYLKSIKLYKELKSDYMVAQGYNNLGITYKNLKKYHEAASLLGKAQQIFSQYEDISHQASCITNIGIIHFEQNQYDSALLYHKKAFELYKANEDTDGMVICYENLSETLIAKYENLKNTKKTENQDLLLQAKFYAEKALGWTTNKYYINVISYSLMNIYKRMGNKAKAFEYASLYIATKDSLFSEEKTKALAQAEAMYKNEKQRYIIEKFNTQKALSQKTLEAQQATNEKQRTIITSIIVGLILVGILLFVVVYFLRLNQIANRKLTLKNHQITKQKEEIAVQRDEIASQRDIVLQQKSQIETYHKALKDSIYYAENIQKAVLPGENHLNELLQHYFVLYKPRDIVSGDFYWAYSKNNLIYLAVADCTGHGVPGSLMSMMAISYLNELMHSTEQLKTDEILNMLRTHIIKSFGKSEHSEKMKDGLDIVLIAVDKNKKLVHFSGANNPLYILKQVENEIKPVFQLVELSPDKMPVGFHTLMKPFSDQVYSYDDGDIIYLTTDGFCDQFGGNENKKFMRKQFKTLLIETAGLAFNEQCEFLKQKLFDWKGNSPQTDDITVIGWKL